MVEYADSALRHYELRGSHLGNIKGYESYGAVQKALAEDPSPFLRGFYNEHPWGTPEKTIARATELAREFGADEVTFIFKYGSMPIEDARRGFCRAGIFSASSFESRVIGSRASLTVLKLLSRTAFSVGAPSF